MTEKVTTVQLTSKSLKLHLIFSYLIIIWGAVLILSSLLDDKNTAGGFLLALAGFIWLGITKARIWWHHN